MTDHNRNNDHKKRCSNGKRLAMIISDINLQAFNLKFYFQNKSISVETIEDRWHCLRRTVIPPSLSDGTDIQLETPQ